MTASTTLPRPSCDPDATGRPRALVISTPTTGMLWFGGWLFTIGLAELGFWKALLGLVIWPYFLGALAR